MHKTNKKLYRDLVKQGWSLTQIDESDIFFLFDLLSEDEEDEVLVYADQVSWL